jgi:uncharacterized protein YndB with AHSA1/START domain
METQSALAPVQRSVIVPLALSHAFWHFTDGIGLWWPPEHTWAGRNLEEIGIEPSVGGRAFECGRHGFACTWGQVQVWEPPERLVLAWYYGADPDVAFDPDQSSEVEIRFQARSRESSEVAVIHRGFERLRDGAAGYRNRMDAPAGWVLILKRYANVDCY